MQILELIDQLDNLVYEAKALPFGSSVRVDPDEVFALLDQMRAVVHEIHARKGPEADGPADQDEPAAGLKRVAETLDALEEPRRPVPPPLTAVAGNQVRSIVETAERTAAELLAEAEEEARGIVAEAARMMVHSKEAKARAEAEAEAVKAEATELKGHAEAEATEVRGRAEVEAGRVLERAERIRSETAASAARMARDQVERMDAATAELESNAARAGAEFEELLDKLRGPAAQLADALGPAAQALRAQMDTLSGRVAAADAPLRALGASPATPEPDAAAEAKAEGDRPAGPDSGDSVEFSFEGLPGAGDRIRAERVNRVEFADTGLADSDDPTDPPEFELEEA